MKIRKWKDIDRLIRPSCRPARLTCPIRTLRMRLSGLQVMANSYKALGFEDGYLTLRRATRELRIAIRILARAQRDPAVLRRFNGLRACKELTAETQRLGLEY